MCGKCVAEQSKIKWGSDTNRMHPAHSQCLHCQGWSPPTPVGPPTWLEFELAKEESEIENNWASETADDRASTLSQFFPPAPTLQPTRPTGDSLMKDFLQEMDPKTGGGAGRKRSRMEASRRVFHTQRTSVSRQPSMSAVQAVDAHASEADYTHAQAQSAVDQVVAAEAASLEGADDDQASNDQDQALPVPAEDQTKIDQAVREARQSGLMPV